MSDEFDKRIDLVCIATGLKKEEVPKFPPAKLSSLAELERKEARENASSLMPDWLTAAYSDSREMLQSIPLPTVVPSDVPVVAVATLPPGADPSSVTATLYSESSPTSSAVDLPVNEYGGPPVAGVNVFVREDENGINSVYVYHTDPSTTFSVGTNLQIRYTIRY